MEKISNVEVCYWLTDWCKECGIPPEKVNFKIDHKKRIIYIFSSRIGWIIGKAGIYSTKYKEKLKELIDKKNDIRKKIKDYKLKDIKYYTYELIEVTEANFWVDYEWGGE